MNAGCFVFVSSGTRRRNPRRCNIPKELEFECSLQGDTQITVVATFLRRQRSDSLENSRVRKLGYFTVFLSKRFLIF